MNKNMEEKKQNFSVFVHLFFVLFKKHDGQKLTKKKTWSIMNKTKKTEMDQKLNRCTKSSQNDGRKETTKNHIKKKTIDCRKPDEKIRENADWIMKTKDWL